MSITQTKYNYFKSLGLDGTIQDMEKKYWEAQVAGAGRTPYVLAQSGVAVPLTGVTDETILATITVPANTLGANGSIRITAGFSYTSSTNTKTPRIKFGGASGMLLFGPAITTANAQVVAQVSVHNRNSQNSQISSYTSGTSTYSTSTTSPATGTIDTTQAQTILITGQLAVGTETLTLERYTVEVIPF
jgi:hypothetical protein